MKNGKTYDMALTAMGAVMLAICSWISVPTAVPFTMQTFGLFFILDVLGGKRATGAVFVYILLGAAGLPVFAGFTGGVGVLAGATGGYIIGFLCSGLLYWLLEPGFSEGGRQWMRIFTMILCLAACYAFGTVWYMAGYAKTAGAVGLISVLGWCVFPFILPDLIKMAMALFLGKRVKKSMRVLQ